MELGSAAPRPPEQFPAGSCARLPGGVNADPQRRADQTVGATREEKHGENVFTREPARLSSNGNAAQIIAKPV